MADPPVPQAAMRAAAAAVPFTNRDAMRRIIEYAAPHIRAAERERLVKWMHTEAVRLGEQSLQGIPAHDDQMRRITRAAQEDTSQSLITAIAHLSALGQLDALEDDHAAT